MEAYRKIKEITAFLKMREGKEEKTRYTVSAFKSGTVYDVVKDGEGAESCEEDILKAIEQLRPEKIIVVAYSGNPQRNSKQVGKWEFAAQQQAGNGITVTIPHAQVPKSELPQKTDDFSGLGGIGAYLDFQKQIMNLEFDKRMLDFQIAELKKQNEKLSRENEVLQEELDDVSKENEELNGVNANLEKFVPGNFKLFGMDGTKLLGAVATNFFDNYMKRNPAVICKLTGLNETDIKGLLGVSDAASQAVTDTNTTTTFETVHDEDSERSILIRDVVKWLNELTDEGFSENIAVIGHIYQHPGDLKQIIEFINTLQNAEV